MNCERINKLLDKYWECGTTLEEERELRYFFTSEFVPSELEVYKSWFLSDKVESLPPLGENFDRKIINCIAEEGRRHRFRSILRTTKHTFLIVAVVIGILWVFKFFF